MTEKARPPILLTGGAGYVGAHAAKYLHGKGYLPIVYDNLSRGHREFVKWGPLFEGDTGDRDALRQCIRQYKPIAAMHFAAFAYVEESVRNPGLYYHNNVANSIVLFDALVEAGVDKLVFSSSCASYGIPAKIPIEESDPQNPINPYGWSKLMVEKVLQDYDRAYGLKSISLRYFNAAGADPDGEIGEWHDPETHLIPIVLEAALGLRSHIELFGNDYPTPDGTCVRDYVHVMDIAQGHHLAMEKLLSGEGSDSFNLGNGVGYSILDVVSMAHQITGRKIGLSPQPRRPGDPPVLVSRKEKSETQLGWRPKYDELKVIMSTAWKWTRRADIAVGE